MKKNTTSDKDKEVQRAIDKARKRWELNLIKTGNIAANYNSGNTVRKAGKSDASRRARDLMSTAIPSTNPSDVAVVHELTNQQISVRPVIIEEKIACFDVFGSPTFSLVSYDIQPGLVPVGEESVMFPIICNVARNYEKYSFQYLDLVFVPFVSGFDGDGARGQVNLSADYNVMSAEPSTILAAERNDPHVTAMAKDRMRLRLDPKKLNPTSKYIRSGDYPAGGDPKSYDAGVLFIATTGQNDTQKIGTIYVEFKLHLYNIRDESNAIPPPPVIPNRAGSWQSWRYSGSYNVSSTWQPVGIPASSMVADEASSPGPQVYFTSLGGLRLTAEVNCNVIVTWTVAVDCTDSTDNRNSAVFGACMDRRSSPPGPFDCYEGSFFQAGTVGALNQPMGNKRNTFQAIWIGKIGPSWDPVKFYARGIGYDPVGLEKSKETLTPMAPGPFDMTIGFMTVAIARLTN